jgi:hypothetical protein
MVPQDFHQLTIIVFWNVRRVVWKTVIDISDKFPYSSVLKMEAVSFAETLVTIYHTTRRRIPKGSSIHRRESLISPSSLLPAFKS